MTDPILLTPRQFAERLGYKPNYGNQLAKDGRLVFAPDGKHVLLAESLARFEATKDPSRQGVVDRHAAARAEQAPPRTEDPAEPADLPAGDTRGNVHANYNVARAAKERYLALSARRDYEISMGTLLEKNSILAAVADAAVTLRSTLERLPYTLGPVLAGVQDEHTCIATIADHVEQALTECTRAFHQLTDPPQP